MAIDQNTITNNSIVVTNRDGVAQTVSLNGTVAIAGGFQATFTVTPESGVEDFYHIEAPDSAVQNVGATIQSDESFLGVQEVQLAYPINLSNNPPVYPTALFSDRVNTEFSFDWTPVAGDTPAVYKGGFTSMIGQYADDPNRGATEEVVTLDVDNNEIRIQCRDNSDEAYGNKSQSVYPAVYNPGSFNFVVGQTYAISIRFRGTLTQVFVDDALAFEANDTRLAPTTNFGWRTSPPASVSNPEINQIQPLNDLAINQEAINWQRVQPNPIYCGGTKGLDNRFYNFEIIDTAGTHLDGTTPARYVVLSSGDHKVALDSDDMRLRWVNDPLDIEGSAVTNWTVFYSTASLQVETPRAFYLSAENTWLIYCHAFPRPVSPRQSTTLLETTDLVNFTFIGDLLPADSNSNSAERIYHTGYWNGFLLNDGSVRGVSLGPAADEDIVANTDRIASNAYRGFLLSESNGANLRVLNRLGHAKTYTNTPRRFFTAANTLYFERNNQIFAICAHHQHLDASFSNASTAVVSARPSVQGVSSDLTEYSRREDALLSETLPWEQGIARPLGLHQVGNTLYAYIGYTLSSGNPGLTGNDDPYWVGLYQADLSPANSAVYASPAGLAFVDTFEQNPGLVTGSRTPDQNNNLGGSWSAQIGSFLPGTINIVDGYARRDGVAATENAGLIYDYSASPNSTIEITAEIYDLNDVLNTTTGFNFLFDWQGQDDFKMIQYNQAGELQYRERVSGVNTTIATETVETVDPGNGVIGDTRAYYRALITPTNASFYRNEIRVLQVTEDFSSITKACGFFLRMQAHKINWYQLRVL